MHSEYLVRMANDIGAFFASEGDPEVAAAGIHQHIKRFWDPRMRSRIVAHFHETGGEGLDGPVRKAIEMLAEEMAAKA
jgi:formate dehydrogenase subunit delta